MLDADCRRLAQVGSAQATDPVSVLVACFVHSFKPKRRRGIRAATFGSLDGYAGLACSMQLTWPECLQTKPVCLFNQWRIREQSQPRPPPLTCVQCDLARSDRQWQEIITRPDPDLTQRTLLFLKPMPLETGKPKTGGTTAVGDHIDSAARQPATSARTYDVQPEEAAKHDIDDEPDETSEPPNVVAPVDPQKDSNVQYTCQVRMHDAPKQTTCELKKACGSCSVDRDNNRLDRTFFYA